MTTIHVKGMSCKHCSQAVSKALSEIPGISEVNVDLSAGVATFTEDTPVNMDDVRAAIERIGFEVA